MCFSSVAPVPGRSLVLPTPPRGTRPTAASSSTQRNHTRLRIVNPVLSRNLLVCFDSVVPPPAHGLTQRWRSPLVSYTHTRSLTRSITHESTRDDGPPASRCVLSPPETHTNRHLQQLRTFRHAPGRAHGNGAGRGLSLRRHQTRVGPRPTDVPVPQSDGRPTDSSPAPASDSSRQTRQSCPVRPDSHVQSDPTVTSSQSRQ